MVHLNKNLCARCDWNLSINSISVKDLSFERFVKWTAKEEIDCVQIRCCPRGYDFLNMDNEYIKRMLEENSIQVRALCTEIELSKLLRLDAIEFSKYIRYCELAKFLGIKNVRVLGKLDYYPSDNIDNILAATPSGLMLLFEPHSQSWFCPDVFDELFLLMESVSNFTMLADTEQFLLYGECLESNRIEKLFSLITDVHHCPNTHTSISSHYLDVIKHVKHNSKKYEVCLENYRNPDSISSLVLFNCLRNGII